MQAPCVVSLHNYVNPHRANIIADLTLNKQHFCDLCHYRCMLGFKESKDPYFEKLHAVTKAFEKEGCETVMWVDFDSVIVTPFRIDFATDWFSKDWFGLNSGIFVLRRNEKNLNMLKQLSNFTLAERTGYAYQEQGAIKHYLQNLNRSDVVSIADVVHYAFSRDVAHDLPIWHAAGLSKRRDKAFTFLQTALNKTTHTPCESLQHVRVRSLRMQDLYHALRDTKW
jgi:hypothetical protein